VTELAKTPWVDRTANAVWSRIVAASPRPEWVPRHTTKRGGKISVEEFGCGHYGCVMPTSDDAVVCKITSDATEAAFVTAALSLGFGEETEGIVRYYAVYELPNRHRGRPVFVLWRESATEVGLPYGFGDSYEERRIANLSRYLGSFKECAAAARDTLKRSDDPWALLAEAKRHEEWAWRRGAEFNLDTVTGVVGIRRTLPTYRGAMRVALALRLCDVIAELMQNTDGSDLIGSALRYYLEQGLLLADVHANNVGKIERTSGWVITDPGHAVPLEQRWAVVSVPGLP
jgi:hypothetical protein